MTLFKVMLQEHSLKRLEQEDKLMFLNYFARHLIDNIRAITRGTS